MRMPSPQEFAALIRDSLPKQAPKLTLAQTLWAGAGVVLALSLLWLAWPRPRTFEVALIDRGPVRSEVIDEGRTRMHEVFVIAAPVGGQLQRIEIEPGDMVAAGQVVATILPADPALLDARIAAEANAAVAAAQAAVAAADADYQLALRDRARVAALHAQGFASPAALDGAEAAMAAARAALNARRADLTRAPALVRAPSPGRVLRVLQESETIAPAGAALIEIGDPSDIEIVAEFLSQDAIQMQAGARASIENWGGEDAIAARVSRIEPFARTKISALGVEEQRVNVIVRLEDPARAPPLGHGFRVDVRVVLSEEANALRVSTDALVRDGRGWAVFVLERGRARLTPIVLGGGGEDFRAVESGLALGQTVILFPGDALADGSRVRAAGDAR